jgi:hypothetical protein
VVNLEGDDMKKLVKVEEVEGEGLVGLMGENVLLMCANYFYHGKLIGVNEQFVQLENAGIVYETGAWTTTQFADKQKIGPKYWYVTTRAIESYGAIR